MFVKPTRYVSRVFLHCTASSYPHHDDIEVVRKWHVEGRGWSDVGYHYMVHRGGSISVGRDIERIPAAQKGHNKGSIAIALHGGGHGKDDFGKTQLRALKRFCDEINQAYDGNITFHGHSEVALRDCPVYDYRSLLGLDEKGAM